MQSRITSCLFFCTQLKHGLAICRALDRSCLSWPYLNACLQRVMDCAGWMDGTGAGAALRFDTPAPRAREFCKGKELKRESPKINHVEVADIQGHAPFKASAYSGSAFPFDPSSFAVLPCRISCWRRPWTPAPGPRGPSRVVWPFRPHSCFRHSVSSVRGGGIGGLGGGCSGSLCDGSRASSAASGSAILSRALKVVQYMHM